MLMCFRKKMLLCFFYQEILYKILLNFNNKFMKFSHNKITKKH